MTRKTILIVCFILAGLISGCRNDPLSNPADKINHRYSKSIHVDEKSPAVEAADSPDKNSPVVIAYYFHRTLRCFTCLTIEANAARVIEENVSRQISNGTLTWIPFNLDESGGREFEEAFDVSASTLVLPKMEGGGHTKYKKPEKAWEVGGVHAKFDSYVKKEVGQFMND